MFGLWLYVDTLFPTMRRFQEKHRGDPNWFQHPADRLVPLNYDEFDWQDNIYLQKFVCNMTQTKYTETMNFDAVGKGWWNEVKTFKFDCKITYFANDKFRVLHYSPMRDDAYAEFYNTDPSLGGKVKLEEKEKRTINFKRASYFAQNLYIEFDKEMEGIRMYTYMFHSYELGDQSLYNGWNFTETGFWDDFT